MINFLQFLGYTFAIFIFGVWFGGQNGRRQ